MKKISSLFVSILILIFCGITVFAINFVPIEPSHEPLKTFPTKELQDECYLVSPFGEQFYVILDNGKNFKDIEIESNGIVSAKLVDYDPETMVDYIGDDVENKFVTYKVYDTVNETDVAVGLSYFIAKEIAAESEDYSVAPESYVNIIEINVGENFSDSYKEGTLRLRAKLDEKTFTGEMKIISDIFIKDFSETNILSASAETLESSPIEEIKGAYVDQSFETVIGTALGAKKFSKSGSIPDGLTLSGNLTYNNTFGDYVLKMSLSGKPTKAGTYNFTVGYLKEDGTVVKKVDYTITVGADAPFDYVDSIYLQRWPTKTEYHIGDTVDLTGMRVTAIVYSYDEKDEVYKPSEIDVTDLVWVEPAVFTSDEAQDVNVYLKAPGDSKGKLDTFEDHFRVTFKYDNVEPEETPETDEYIELNVLEDAGYSSYYGGESSLETPAYVISAEGFKQAQGGKAVINGKLNFENIPSFTLTIPKVNSAQKGINFFYNASYNLSGNYGYPSIKFYSDAIIQSDYVFEWNLGMNYYELRELLGLKVEEGDVFEFYVIDSEEKCVGKFTVDYMNADVIKEVKLKFNIPEGSNLPDYRITTSVPEGDYYIPNVDGYVGVSNTKSTMKISSEIIPVGKTGKVFVELSQNSKASAIQFALKYDPAVLKLVSCKADEIVENATINSSVAGEIGFAWENLGDLEKGGNLLELEFEAIEGNESQKTMVEVDKNKKIIFARGDFSDINVEVINGEIDVLNVLYGDINGDSSVDVRDAYCARLVAAKLYKITELQKLFGDVDGDGRVTAIDSNYIRKYSVGTINEFPVENQ